MLGTVCGNISVLSRQRSFRTSLPAQSVLHTGEEECTASVSWFVPVALPVDNAVMLQWAERLCFRVESFNVGKTNLTCHEPFTPTLSSPSHLPHVFCSS